MRYHGGCAVVGWMCERVLFTITTCATHALTVFNATESGAYIRGLMSQALVKLRLVRVMLCEVVGLCLAAYVPRFGTALFHKTVFSSQWSFHVADCGICCLKLHAYYTESACMLSLNPRGTSS